ncbi:MULTISPECIES: energy-coupling factor transporter transmembrane protein EcfT [unclassified Leptolyngbya]|uniref:energy-coupling factor transporter transmembrane component T family protein n=1 Tax=unclassified Leptolyngbya TaxID=2650499 RepID=UPI001684F23C|nr:MULTISPECIES: energy-coupling factor transporter transmembrane protein EcfT [unclassified Leptolyngbya]MBD1910562.1 energy-coupling factor transporter transmembrane protein EcfT [Leptolyngbya sp. FACHB-8]MBD2153933.1 energy-coupling factor transporter transmembrane protein EcfT [Leptolyngbya sp. FACHB-16]
MDLLRSLPIGLYLEKPVTWLHSLDPRVKFAWLMAFLLTPIGASPYWRLSLLGWMLLLMLSTGLPFRVWWKQLGLVTLFSLLLFLVTVFAPDGITVSHQPRFPIDDLSLTLPDKPPTVELPQPTGYRYELFEWRFLRVTRRSLDLAVRLSTLVFTFLASTNLYLLTTAPEEVTTSLEHLMRPLKRLNIPVAEIVLTLTLALRFIPLVLEEVQNLIRSIRTRAIHWKKLGLRNSAQVWLVVSERLVDNLLVRADQTANAMQVRGFTTPDQHRMQWYQLRMRSLDWLVLIAAGLFVVARLVWGGIHS